MKSNILDVSGLTKSYTINREKRTVVSDFSFTLGAKGITGLAGPTGAGKTTLIKMICGLTSPDSGSVRINDYTPRNRLYYSQFSALPDGNHIINPKMTIEENMDYLYRMKRGQKPSTDDHKRYLLQSYDLLPFRYKPVSHLSQSMQLMTAIIVNLYYSPSLFILDEPDLGNDEANNGISSIIRKLSANYAFLIASSDMLLLAEICDRIILMDEGREVLEKPLDDLIENDICLAQAYPGCVPGEVGLVP